MSYLQITSFIPLLVVAIIIICVVTYCSIYKNTINNKSQGREKFSSFHGFSMNRKSFPDECSVEQWISLALSIQMKQKLQKLSLCLDEIK